MERTMQDVGTWLDANVEPWMAVDPATFVRACLELEVWDACEDGAPFDDLADYFDDDLAAATHRFVDVAVALNDGTLAEFQFDTDDGRTHMATEIFWTAATAPFDDAGEMLDRRAWRRAIADMMASDE